MTKTHINEISKKIIAVAIEVHKNLGPGLLEEIYKDAMIVELTVSGLKFEVEKEIDVYYKTYKLRRKYRQDLIVEDCVIIELKAVDSISPIFKAKLATYLELNQKPKGFIFNFNVLNLTGEGMVPWVNHLYAALPE